MAAPRTWVADEVVTAALLNTEVRDKFLANPADLATAAGQTVYSTASGAIAMVAGAKYKTADENVNNSTTLQNDDHLVFPVAANEVWAFSAFLYFTIASGDPGFKWTFTVPASCTGWYQSVDGNANVGSGAVAAASNVAIASTLTKAYTGLTSFLVTLKGVVINSSTAGSVQFQWAQNSAVASNLTLKLGSYIDLKRLA